MRFNENGPNIPDELLDKCDHGKVVFFCGAGVSFNSKLPDFIGLTEQVMRFFSPPEDSEVHKMFTPWLQSDEHLSHPKIPLDQVFHMLYQDYGRDQVNRKVAEILSEFEPSGSRAKEHAIIKRLSRNVDGSPKVVTTNFDKLFELNDDTVTYWEPPVFPDLASGVNLEGIVYLHGRLKNISERTHPYILSSADFGRAYLAEGWATKFILQLLDSYTLVLVGYQAEDPQVKYLLQGLNHNEDFDRSKIFAFDKGDTENVESKWRDRGVTGVAYSEHTDLWDTLSVWADKIDNQKKWRDNTLKLAQSDPKKLSPFQRGQVANLISTTAGAKLFSQVEPSPTTEWLCVFDAHVRTRKASSCTEFFHRKAETFDPFMVYGLDDDPPRPEEKEQLSTLLPHKNYLAWLPFDSLELESLSLHSSQSLLPPRLWYLKNWIVQNLNSPIVAWWAAQKNELAATLREEIIEKLANDKQLPPKAVKILNIIANQNSRVHSRFFPSHCHYRFEEVLKAQGWNTTTLQFFETEMNPFVDLRPPTGLSSSKPPMKSWEDLHIRDIFDHEIKFPLQLQHNIEVPDKYLYRILLATLQHLRNANDLAKALDTEYYFIIPTCYAISEEDDYNLQEHSAFYLFLEKLKLLVDFSPLQAKALSLNLTCEHSIYFTKLALFSHGYSSLFSPHETINYLLSLDQEHFWDDNYKLDILKLLQKRWSDLLEPHKEKLAKRILEGPPKSHYETDSEHEHFKFRLICTFIEWLKSKDLELPELLLNEINRVDTQGDELVKADLAELEQATSSRIYRVTTDDDSAPLRNTPISDIIERSKQLLYREPGSRVAEKPFNGLVKSNPKRAILALSYQAKRGCYPIEFWSALLDYWPEKTSKRECIALLSGLKRIPPNHLIELRFFLNKWLENYFSSYLTELPALSWQLVDHCIFAIQSESYEQISSKNNPASACFNKITLKDAYSSLAGTLINTLIHQLGSMKLAQNNGIPDVFLGRFNQLLESENITCAYAAASLCYQISFLDYIDSHWTERNLISMLNLEHKLAGPSWSGICANRLLHEKVSSAFRPFIIKLFPTVYEWNWERNLLKLAADKLIELSLPDYKGIDKIKPSEARNCIRGMKENERAAAIHYIGLVCQKDETRWQTCAIPLIEKIWPRERGRITKIQTLAWVRLLENSGEHLPGLLEALEWCLAPFDFQNHWLYTFTKSKPNSESIASQYPEATLKLCSLLIQEETKYLPYKLKEALEIIEQAEPKLSIDKPFIKLTKLLEAI